MHKADYCIVGAGIVGLATAYALIGRNPKGKIVVLEKESVPGFHQTGHNSGVIHAGIYYVPGSLKAVLCRQGLDETKAFCNQYNIPYEECGKLIVATNDVELERIESLYERATANDLKLDKISGSALREKEPNIVGLEALPSPETAIVDYKLVARRLSELLIAQGVEIRYGQSVVDIVEDANRVSVKTPSGLVDCEQLIVCGGLQSDRLAELAGMDVDFRIVPFRGEYFRLRDGRNDIVNHLIYPAPDPELPFLGVHLTRMIGGYVTVGLNAVIGFAREGYDKWSFNLQDSCSFAMYPGFWKLIKKYRKHAVRELHGSLSRAAYLKECQKYCPSLTLGDFLPYRAGIRAQAVTQDGVTIHDFMFKQTERMLHVCNAPSPAATSALPIGRMIADKCAAV
jgi:(S)-2-hydroxyglutarate dehydrogenase